VAKIDRSCTGSLSDSKAGLAHRVRMQSLLAMQGSRLKIKSSVRFDELPLWDGRPLPEELKAELARERKRLRLPERQIAALETERRERLRGDRQ